MAEDFDRLLERMRSARAWRDTAARVTSALASSPTPTTSGGFAPGSRVFDTISGEEGEVVGRTSENVVVPAAK